MGFKLSPPQASDSFAAGSLYLEDLCLWRNFQMSPVLEGLNLELKPGCVTALCGPNGSGKSTLVAALCGHEAYGIRVTGERYWKDSSDRVLALEHGLLLPQSQAFVPSDLVATFCGFFKDRSGFDVRRFEQLCDIFEVAHLMDCALGELSGGEWKRVQCACHFALSAPLRLLDEAEASLDGYGIRKLASQIRDCRERGEVIVLASHSLSFVRLTADRVAYLDNGRLTWFSSIREFMALGSALDLGP